MCTESPRDGRLARRTSDVTVTPIHVHSFNFSIQMTIYSRSSRQRPRFRRIKNVVDDRKSLVTGMGFFAVKFAATNDGDINPMIKQR